MTQLKNRKQKDWITQVLEDIKDLKLNVDLEEIKLMKKSKLKQILKNSTEEKALEEFYLYHQNLSGSQPANLGR